MLFCSEMKIAKKEKKGCSLSFPWWCLFIAYGLSMVFAGVSMFFIIVRGIEFGDVKTQQWLTSLLTGFFSSILVIQPLKVRSSFGKKIVSMGDVVRIGVGFGSGIFIFVSKYREGQRSR